MDDLIAFYGARLDEIEQAAIHAGHYNSFIERGLGERWESVRTGFELSRRQVQTAQPGMVVHQVVELPNPWHKDLGTHIALNDPQSALADIAADRAILAEYAKARYIGWADAESGARLEALEQVVKIRAGRFSDHPGYQAAWKP